MELFAFIGNIHATELILILIIVLVLFGGAKIPQLMRNLGKGVKEFKEGISEGKSEPAQYQPPPPPPAPTQTPQQNVSTQPPEGQNPQNN